MHPRTRALVVTVAPVVRGRLDAVAELFAATNPTLVEDQPDWLEAVVAVDREEGRVTVVAGWADADSYRRFAASERFLSTMARFAEHLAGPPRVTVHEVALRHDAEGVHRP
jgi:heme-degrading monooxygenase HmoA